MSITSNVDDFSFDTIPVKNLNSAIVNWRDQLDEPSDIVLTDKELKTIRNESAEREFSWDE